jgi:5-formaminoimidazole-4-carboxamide-1-(beta)-D-ribofuranosyl 5'-monophosphate synthetase
VTGGGGDRYAETPPTFMNVDNPLVAASLASYDLQQLTLCSIGSHSALEVAAGANAAGLRNLIVAERGRERTYTEHFAKRTGPTRGCIDQTIVLDRFSDILDTEVQNALIAANVIFLANRSFEVYLHQRYSYSEIESGMLVPFFGNRRLLRAEERDEANNQYDLMLRADIRFPLQFRDPSEIDRLVMVKAPHAKVSFERAFFLVRSPAEYEEKSERLIAQGIVTRTGLAGALIEEFALGPTVNLNFFYSPLLGELELLGTDTRRQTNLDGLRGLPFAQAQQLADEPVRMEEAGHIATTLTESMLEKAFEMGERFVHATQQADPPGIIGPFALQCVIVAGPPKAFVCYDVSLRIPGSPGTRYTPYGSYRWGRDISVGERIAREIVDARDSGRLGEVLT